MTTTVISRSACASGNSREAPSSSPSSPRCRRTDFPLTEFPNDQDRPEPAVGRPEEEAAWQVLKPFINVIDCNHYVHWKTPDGKLLDDVYAMNTNETLNRLFNGESVKLKYLSKARFFEHCRGNRKYYYRSQWNAAPCTGYGSGKNSHRRLSFDAARYAMADKKHAFKNLGIILIGFDIDAHKGEPDVDKTTNLILEMFPGAYAEPSTNGRGCHVYVKLLFPAKLRGNRHRTLRYIAGLVESVKDLIEQDRIKRGYAAPLDLVAGLPTDVGFVDERLKITKRTKVIKMPFYKLDGFRAVDQFFQAPWYRVEYLEDVVSLRPVSPFVEPDSQAADDNNLVDKLLDAVSDGCQEEVNEAITPLLPLTPPKKTYPSVQRAYPSIGLTYETHIQDLKAIEDSRQRRLEFGLLLSRRMGRVPTPSELKQEYIRSGVYRQTSESDKDDHRYDQLVKFLEKGFDPDKAAFSYLDYPRHRQEMESLLLAKTHGLELTWRKGGETKPISIIKLAALYWSIRHSQGRADFTRFSYGHVRIAVRQTLDQGVHRLEIARMLAILEQIGLVQRVCEAVWGMYGTGWRATPCGGSCDPATGGSASARAL